MSTRPEPAYLQIRLAVLIHDWRRTQIAEKTLSLEEWAKTFALLKAKYLRIIKILLKNERSFIDTDNNAKNALEAGDAFVLAHSTVGWEGDWVDPRWKQAAADRLKEQRLCMEREQKFHAELDAVLGLDFDSFKFDYTSDDFVLSTVTDPPLSNTPFATPPANARKRKLVEDCTGSQELKRVRPSHPPTFDSSCLPNQALCNITSPAVQNSHLQLAQSHCEALSPTPPDFQEPQSSQSYCETPMPTPAPNFQESYSQLPSSPFGTDTQTLATNFQHSHFQFSKSRSETPAPTPSPDLTESHSQTTPSHCETVMEPPIPDLQDSRSQLTPSRRETPTPTPSPQQAHSQLSPFCTLSPAPESPDSHSQYQSSPARCETPAPSDSNLTFSSCETLPMRTLTPAFGDDHFLLDVLPESYPYGTPTPVCDFQLAPSPPVRR
ncbi:hypothetical protein BDP27DRAFT_1450534 [Rhodocollybia butyracea]|uniref:Uncharacterized protein n=1 Tax=Rhodocollybia butyracea TaxID=206335 RepID=A0A9P5U3F2_9AGAR|nr:hypothetical protein BDP27DRAFT_1450534 [Rhodocollybia butyracea]